MKSHYACNSMEHGIARRQFLGGLLGGAGMVLGGVGSLASTKATEKLAKDQKRVVVVNMHGGLSQFESWDPKPKTDTGGPFRAIPTAVPGLHICELLPQTARMMDKLAVIRSVNNRTNSHGVGQYQMTRGRDQMPGLEAPHLGAVCAKALESDNPLPGHIHVPSGGRPTDAAYLGPRYAGINANGNPPANSSRPDRLSEQADELRNAFRRQVNDRLSARRRSAHTDLYTSSYEQALDLMEKRHVFDVSLEPEKEQDRYGTSEFGRHCLMARRLLEHGVPFVQVRHSNYDTHNENFNFHLEHLAEFDPAFSTLIADLDDRGMLESTLVVVLSEFGRTPKINARFGRDHWGKSFSVCLGGAKVQPGAVFGKTNENGTAVADREVDHADLFHTYLSAIGLDPSDTFHVGGRDVPLADPAGDAIHELVS